MVDNPSIQDLFRKQAADYEKTTGGTTRIIAKHLVELASPIKHGANILDNASGPGVVIDELLASVSDDIKATLSITGVDGSPAMLDLFRSRAENDWKLPSDHLHAESLAAEELDSLPSDHFDLSFTNFGFQFFKNPEKAAADIHRTLKPGGRALITAWADLGYLSAIMTASEALRPGQPKPPVPWEDEWFQASHLKTLLENSGFSKVELHQKESRFSAESIDDLAQRIASLIGVVVKGQGWSEENLADLPRELKKALEGHEGGQNLYEVKGGAGVKMVANVAICQKV